MINSFFNSLLNKPKLDNLYPLEDFFPNGISNNPLIHISGDIEIGKTSLALEIMYKNPDKTFLYIDTYFQLQEYQLSKNSILFKSNIIEEITSFINIIDNNILDYIILDGMSNLISEEEFSSSSNIYIDNRYIKLNNWIKEILNICLNKKITLIIFNTINGKGQAYNYSSQINQLCSLDLKIIDKKYNFNNGLYNLTLMSNKNKFKDFYTKDIYTIVLDGKKSELINGM